MEQILKDLINFSYYPIDHSEHLLNEIGADCMRLLKYKPLFKNDSDYEDYEVKICDIIYILILRSKLFLLDYYYEKIDSLHSEENNKMIAEAYENVKTWDAEKIVRTMEALKVEKTEES